jgi:single-stranded DNA-specific DHH superfamily exonuclease
LCLGEANLNQVWEILEDYRKQVSEGIRLLREGNIVFSTPHAYFILAGDKIKDTFIGTITSIALNSNIFDSKKPVFGIAESEENTLKISARLPKEIKNINLREVLYYAAKLLKGEAGGHTHAAGALIDKNLQNDFVNIVDRKLGEMLGQEKS